METTGQRLTSKELLDKVGEYELKFIEWIFKTCEKLEIDVARARTIFSKMPLFLLQAEALGLYSKYESTIVEMVDKEDFDKIIGTLEGELKETQIIMGLAKEKIDETKSRDSCNKFIAHLKANMGPKEDGKAFWAYIKVICVYVSTLVKMEKHL
jgi:hypothetical protein